VPTCACAVFLFHTLDRVTLESSLRTQHAQHTHHKNPIKLGRDGRGSPHLDPLRCVKRLYVPLADADITPADFPSHQLGTMAFINNYTPSQYPLDLYGPDPWDINFVFPVPVSIENDVVRLTPFIPRLHADTFWDVAGGSDSDLYGYMVRPLHKKEDLLKQLLDKRESAESCLFLIVDKTKPENPAEGRGLRGVMAGLICYARSSLAHRVSFLSVSGLFHYTKPPMCSPLRLVL
jgi:hypothetical protein